MLKIYKVKCKIQLNKKLTTYLMKNKISLTWLKKVSLRLKNI